MGKAKRILAVAVILEVAPLLIVSIAVVNTTSGPEEFWLKVLTVFPILVGLAVITSLVVIGARIGISEEEGWESLRDLWRSRPENER